MGFNTQDGPKGAIWTYQEKAWTEDVLGIEWFQFFYKHLQPKPTKDEPHLLVVDSHGTHETSGLITKAREQSVEIFSLPGHTTHWLQPLDRSIFKPFKTAYDRICSEHLQNTDNVVSKVTWPGLFQHAFEEAMIPPTIFSGFAATGIYPWNPLAIPICAFLPYKAFQEGSMATPTKRHPLAWAMDKVAEIEATITLEAADNNVLSILRSSIENKNPPRTATSTLQKDSNGSKEDQSVDVGVSNEQEQINVTMPEAEVPNETPSSDQVSPVIPLDSGINMRDLLEPEVSSFLDANINDLMIQIGQERIESDASENMVSVNPVIRLDGQTSECVPLTDAQAENVVKDVFTPKIRGKVKTRGGMRGGGERREGHHVSINPKTFDK